jgi:hypothetical protein
MLAAAVDCVDCVDCVDGGEARPDAGRSVDAWLEESVDAGPCVAPLTDAGERRGSRCGTDV